MIKELLLLLLLLLLPSSRQPQKKRKRFTHPWAVILPRTPKPKPMAGVWL